MQDRTYIRGWRQLTEIAVHTTGQHGPHQLQRAIELCTGVGLQQHALHIPPLTICDAVRHTVLEGQVSILVKVLTCKCSLCVWWQDCSICLIRWRVVEGGLFDLQDRSIMRA